ncbi:glutathione S-transferase family protein [Halioxenophilus aromaticivorans]|uniref:GST N-terminal domain-containing protein n=1 Tax=Halioxenophilus aromaticivorans TaxID=1306992 RepID=A0AAV3U8P1_9ALTE
MTTILYGSTTSPYVRRIRLLLEDSDYQFEPVNVYEQTARQAFSDISPIRKLPVLKIDDNVIYDSGVISQYWLMQAGADPLTVQQHNLISAVDAATDSLIIIMQSKNSGLTVDESKLFYDLQIGRVEACFDWLETQAEQGAFAQWDYPTIALLTLVGWVEFRQLRDLSVYPAIEAALAPFANRPSVLATVPQA